MINTSYTTTTAEGGWIHLAIQVDETKWEQFIDINHDPALVQEGIDQGWIVRTEDQ
jgi:hypothetical protein